MSTHLEHDYIGLTEPLERTPEKLSNENEKQQDSCMNLKETELRLGLPGSQSPERKPSLGVSLFGNSVNVANIGSCLGSLKSPVSGAKRGYSDALDGSSPKWSLVKPLGVLEHNNNSSSQRNCVSDVVKKDAAAVASSAKPAPASKAQVVGWPPIRSYRKNSMASNMAKNNDESESKSSECLYVKVSMDGAPYLRKVDLKIYKNYMDLSAGLEKMFSCFTIGQYGSNGLQCGDGLTESRLMDLLNGSEYVLTYEDKDCDWMLVGDVPWEMFTDSCRRLRIMKSSEAIGLAPRAMEKCKTRN